MKIYKCKLRIIALAIAFMVVMSPGYVKGMEKDQNKEETIFSPQKRDFSIEPRKIPLMIWNHNQKAYVNFTDKNINYYDLKSVSAIAPFCFFFDGKGNQKIKISMADIFKLKKHCFYNEFFLDFRSEFVTKDFISRMKKVGYTNRQIITMTAENLITEGGKENGKVTIKEIFECFKSPKGDWNPNIITLVIDGNPTDECIKEIYQIKKQECPPHLFLIFGDKAIYHFTEIVYKKNVKEAYSEKEAYFKKYKGLSFNEIQSELNELKVTSNPLSLDLGYMDFIDHFKNHSSFDVFHCWN
jgi:hypothetical protein